MEKLQELRLPGMAKALEEQLQMTGLEELGFAERLGLLVDRELTERENRRLKTRLDKARLRQAAVVEDVDLRTPRGLDRSLFLSLCSCDWIRQRLNVLITGPTRARARASWPVPWPSDAGSPLDKIVSHVETRAGPANEYPAPPSPQQQRGDRLA